MALVPPTKEQFKHICENIHLKPEQLEQDVKTMGEWLKMQPHLPQDAFDETMLSGFITSSKNSLQITKEKIDMYLTNRTTYPEFYSNRDPKSEDILESEKVIQLFALPELTPEGYRVNISSVIDTDPDQFHYIPYIKRVLNLSDVKYMSERYNGGDYLLCDIKGMNLKHLTKISLTLSRNFVHCAQDSTPMRLKGIFFINAPSITEMLINLFKPFLKEKQIKRIHICSLEDVYKYIPKDILPYEFGGKAGKKADLHSQWNEYVLSFREWFLKDAKRRVDESKRPEKSVFKPKQLFGIDGSFKKLSID